MMSIYFFSFGYLGIVQVGKNIDNNQSWATYPKKLVKVTDKLLKESKQDVLLKFNGAYNEWFGSLISW